MTSAGLDKLDEITARKVMQTGVATVSPELPVAAFQEFLTGEEISGAPVTDENGGLSGVASKTDIVRFLTTDPTLLSDEVLRDVTVGEIMTTAALTVDVGDSVREVARRMLEGNVHRVIVTEDGQIRGILTTFDLLRLLL